VRDGTSSVQSKGRPHVDLVVDRHDPDGPARPRAISPLAAHEDLDYSDEAFHVHGAIVPDDERARIGEVA
jgi:hypothetical protein